MPGLAATTVALGLCRFGYGPAMPALIEGSWLTVSQAHSLVWIHLSGYLAATLLPVATALGLRLRLAAAAAALAATAIPAGFAWLAGARFAAGAAGAALLALGPAIALRRAPAERRESVAALIYTGGGYGLALAGLLAAMLLAALPGAMPAAYWAVLAVVSGIFIAVIPVHRSLDAVIASPVEPLAAAPVPRSLILTTALFGTALATPTLWWAEILTRLPADGRTPLGSFAAALMTALVGIAAIGGPAIEKALARSIGAHRVLPCLLAVMAVGCALATQSTALAPLVIAAVLTGIALTGATVALHKRCAARCQNPAAGWHLLTRVSAGAQVASALAATALPPENFAISLLAGSAAALVAASAIAWIEARP